MDVLSRVRAAILADAAAGGDDARDLPRKFEPKVREGGAAVFEVSSKC